MRSVFKVLVLGLLASLFLPVWLSQAAELEVVKISSAIRVLEPLSIATATNDSSLSHVGPNGQKIQTIVLNDWADETEEDEKSETKIENFAAACTAKPSSDDGEIFMGTSREVAKTRVAKAPIEEPNLTVKSYQASHPTDSEMQILSISKNCDTERVAAENRNVTVAAYLVAAKKEGDNDFHFILQDKDCDSPECRLTVEVSGIPRLNGSKADLKTARQYFEEQWPLYSGHSDVPGSGNYLFFETPIFVRVTGSAFYDADHPVNPATGTGPVGPTGFKTGSAWEIHPVTSFEFDPQTEVSLYALINRNLGADAE